MDGHDVEELCKAFWQAQQVKGKPTCIVAKTFKGRGLKSECFSSHTVNILATEPLFPALDLNVFVCRY